MLFKWVAIVTLTAQVHGWRTETVTLTIPMQVQSRQECMAQVERILPWKKKRFRNSRKIPLTVEIRDQVACYTDVEQASFLKRW